MVFFDILGSLVFNIFEAHNCISLCLIHKTDICMLVYETSYGQQQLWGRWSANASSICHRHVIHFSSPWERSVSIPFTTLWSRGRNLALFQEQWLGITVPQILSLFLQAISLGFPEVFQGLFFFFFFSRNPLALIEHDQKHLAVVYFLTFFGKKVSL